MLVAMLRWGAVAVVLTGCTAGGPIFEVAQGDDDAGVEAGLVDVPKLTPMSDASTARPLLEAGPDVERMPEAAPTIAQESSAPVPPAQEASAPEVATVSPPDAGAGVAYVSVTCSTPSVVVTCTEGWDGGAAISQSNATITAYMPSPLPPQQCSSTVAPRMVCPPKTACQVALVVSGSLVTYQGSCQ